jgi:predicted RNA binding protein YcfA (HicA-like mRNA interferase family)
MGKHAKLYRHILLRTSDANVPFEGLCALLKKLGFRERIKGSHHIFTMDGLDEIINLQAKDGKGKPYQVKQIRNILLKYNVHLGDQR